MGRKLRRSNLTFAAKADFARYGKSYLWAPVARNIQNWAGAGLCRGDASISPGDTDPLDKYGRARRYEGGRVIDLVGLLRRDAPESELRPTVKRAGKKEASHIS